MPTHCKRRIIYDLFQEDGYRMEVRPSSGITNNNILVDRLLGDQYRVVKTVYQNLDSIKPLTEGKVDVDFLKENLNTFQTVTSQKADIKNVSDNLNNILNTPEQAKQYADLSKSYSDRTESSLNAATQLSKTMLTEATNTANTLTEDAYKLKTTADSILEISDDIQIVASIKGDVVTVSQNADDLVRLSGYLDDSFAKPYPIQDWGVIGTNGDSPDETTSPIVIVANSIDQLIEIANNLDYIKDLAQGGKLDELHQLANNIDKYVEQIQVAKQEIEAHLEIFDKKKEDYEQYTNQQIAKLDGLIASHAESIKSVETKFEQTKQELDELKEDCEGIVEQVSRYLIEIKDYYSLCHQRIEVAINKGMRDMQTLYDDLNRRLLVVFDNSIGCIDAAIESASLEATKFLENKANVLFDEFTGKLKADVEIYKQQAKKELEDIVTNSRADFETYVDQQRVKIKDDVRQGRKLLKAEVVESLACIKTEENNAITAIRNLAEKYLTSLATGSSGVYRMKGSVVTKEELPTENVIKGDVYNVEDTGLNYVWTGIEWDSLGMEFNSDLGIIGSN